MPCQNWGWFSLDTCFVWSCTCARFLSYNLGVLGRVWHSFSPSNLTDVWQEVWRIYSLRKPTKHALIYIYTKKESTGCVAHPEDLSNQTVAIKRPMLLQCCSTFSAKKKKCCRTLFTSSLIWKPPASYQLCLAAGRPVRVVLAVA